MGKHASKTRPMNVTSACWEWKGLGGRRMQKLSGNECWVSLISLGAVFVISIVSEWAFRNEI